MMTKIFKEWYNLNKAEIKAEYITVKENRYGYGVYYSKWENDFNEYALKYLTKEEQLALTRDGGKESGWSVCFAMIHQGRLDGYYE